MTGTGDEPRVQPAAFAQRDVLAVYAGLMLAMGVASLDQAIMATALFAADPPPRVTIRRSR